MRYVAVETSGHLWLTPMTLERHAEAKIGKTFQLLSF